GGGRKVTCSPRSSAPSGKGRGGQGKQCRVRVAGANAGEGRNSSQQHEPRSRVARTASVHPVALACVDSRTAARTFLSDGLKSNHFLAISRPSSRTVSSPRFPSTSSTSTPGSFRSSAARLAAWDRVPPQTGHWRIVTFFMGHAPFGYRGAGSPFSGFLLANL